MNSRAYSSTPLSQLNRAELEEILLTVDGRGREVKREALRLLVASAAAPLVSELQGIIDGCCHPTTAVRRISVDLGPIRAALSRFHSSQG